MTDFGSLHPARRKLGIVRISNLINVALPAKESNLARHPVRREFILLISSLKVAPGIVLPFIMTPRCFHPVFDASNFKLLRIIGTGKS